MCIRDRPKTVKTVKEEKKVAVDTKKSSQQETSNGERMMKISMIEPNREQPRKKFDEDALQELSESIKQYGILQPLLVSDKKDYYEIVAGERRWRAEMCIRDSTYYSPICNQLGNQNGRCRETSFSVIDCKKTFFIV